MHAGARAHTHTHTRTQTQTHTLQLLQQLIDLSDFLKYKHSWAKTQRSTPHHKYIIFQFSSVISSTINIHLLATLFSHMHIKRKTPLRMHTHTNTHTHARAHPLSLPPSTSFSRAIFTHKYSNIYLPSGLDMWVYLTSAISRWSRPDKSWYFR